MTDGLEHREGLCAALGRRGHVRVERGRARRELARRGPPGRHGRERDGARAHERRRREVVADRAVALVVVAGVHAERERGV